MCELCDGLHGKSEYNLDFLKEKTGSNSALSGGLDGLNPTREQIDSACLSYRHDYGLMTYPERCRLQTQAKEWLIAWQKEFGLR